MHCYVPIMKCGLLCTGCCKAVRPILSVFFWQAAVHGEALRLLAPLAPDKLRPNLSPFLLPRFPFLFEAFSSFPSPSSSNWRSVHTLRPVHCDVHWACTPQPVQNRTKVAVLITNRKSSSYPFIIYSFHSGLYALSICNKSNHLRWPWTAIMHSVAVYTCFFGAYHKNEMKIDPDRALLLLLLLLLSCYAVTGVPNSQ